MTLTVALTPEEEARLLAEARARSISPDELVGDTLKKLLFGSEDKLDSLAREHIPVRSSYGVLAGFGLAPSADEINRDRLEMFTQTRYSNK